LNLNDGGIHAAMKGKAVSEAYADGVGDTFGVEEEFHIVNGETGVLRPAVATLMSTPAELEPELQRTMVETATKICASLPELRADLVTRRADLVAAASRSGLAVAASGSLPGSGELLGRVYPKARFHWMYEEYRQLVVEQQICACQVHVNVPDRDLAVRVCRRVRAWLPLLLALSASSPMFRGSDTGYASYRTVALSRWPTVGPPPDFESAKDYDEAVSTLVDSGVISDAGMIYYDARPSARYPTVEIRIADACPLVDDVVLLAALSRALVVTAAAEDRAGLPLPNTSPVLLRASTWRAARSGLDADLVDPVGARPVPARRLVNALLEYLEPALRRADEWDVACELIRRLTERGTSSHRQRDLLMASATDAEIVHSIAAETAAA
jgi:carboxylate-amine ligase